MDTERHNDELNAAYAESVEQERAAWEALQAELPATPGRARAWETWSEAIVRTNHAWRRLSAGRLAGRAPVTVGPKAAQQHAGS